MFYDSNYSIIKIDDSDMEENPFVLFNKYEEIQEKLRNI